MTTAEITALRKELRISQRKFAGILGVSLRTVQNWEQGRPPTSSAKKLLDLVGSVLRPSGPPPAVLTLAPAEKPANPTETANPPPPPS